MRKWLMPRRGKTWPLRDHHIQLLRNPEHMLGDLQRIRGGRMERQQCTVEAAKLTP
jgi:hypothetical protein